MHVRAWQLLFLLAACVATARTAVDYEHKAVDTAEAVLSSVRTGALIVRLSPNRAFPPFISVALSDAEGAAGSVRAAFLSVQPPDGRSDDVRARLSPLLDQSEGALSEARIAARRQDFNALMRSAEELSSVASSLEGFIARFG